MNLHALHHDPLVIPTLLDDKRVGKMLMETNQMLSLAVKHHMREQGADYEALVAPDQLTAGWPHYNHPVSIWIRQTYGNFLFAGLYAEALGREFQLRYGKVHASSHRTNFIRVHCQNWIPPGPQTEFQNSARNSGRGLDFTFYPPIEAYRRYMLSRWTDDYHPPQWTCRVDPRPEWEALYEDAV